MEEMRIVTLTMDEQQQWNKTRRIQRLIFLTRGDGTDKTDNEDVVR